MKVFHRIANMVAEHSHFNITSMLLIFNIDLLTYALYFYIFSPQKVRRLFTPYDLSPCGFGSDVDFSVHWLPNGITG